MGQRGAALQTLHDVITSKRHRTWHKVLEQIMFRYVDLCVELKKGRYAKDGLIHYRNVCQQVNVSSLEEVIKYFMKTATDKAEAAKSKAAEVRFLHCFSMDVLQADQCVSGFVSPRPSLELRISFPAWFCSVHDVLTRISSANKYVVESRPS